MSEETLTARRKAWQRRQSRLLELGTSSHYEDAELYDYEYADRTDDIRWYRKFARDHLEAGSLLELGAGTGRITCPLAREGVHVIALDRMGPMLDALRRRLEGRSYAEQVELVEGDFRQIPRDDATIGTVIAPFNGLMHLYTWSDLLQCFREVERVLVPGGRFAFDVQLPDIEWLTWDPDERHAITRFVHPRTKERLVYSTNHTYDPETQICHIRIFYDEAPPRGRKFVAPEVPKKLVHLAHRQIFPEELRMLIAVAGLELEQHTGDFKDLPLREAMDSQVVVARKPGGP